MKTSWQVDSFNLDLTSLWNLTKGISLQSEHRTLFDTAWNNFKKKSDSSLIGFFDWPAHCPQNEFAKILSLSQTISKNFEGAICIGIGGSYLGPAALQEALVSCSSASHFPVLWVSNADDGTLLRAKHFLKNRRAATVVISKSGVTTETLAAWFHLSHELDPTGYVLITDPEKGELRRLSRTENWHSLAIPPNIGGRFSVLTSVGLFPLALQGVDVQELIKGARAMREHLLATSPQENPAVWFAYSKYLWDKQGHSIQYFMPYDSRLKLIGDWYVQLWAES
ncbi:MAG: hypothetical protein EB078_01325, partial [Proteobacteria bacterium]|nr:hypothetical protein [Pseudomonadota bacterium]